MRVSICSQPLPPVPTLCAGGHSLQMSDGRPFPIGNRQRDGRGFPIGMVDRERRRQPTAILNVGTYVTGKFTERAMKQ